MVHCIEVSDCRFGVSPVNCPDPERILHECSCIIEFIKRVGEKDKMRGFAKHFIVFPNEFNKFNNSGARMQDSIYHMTLKSHFISKFCT